jgi:calcium-dependent protein kinase
MDLDKNGKINYNEFIASMVSEEYCQKKDYLDYIFQYFDADRNGKISRQELAGAINRMGFEVPAKFIHDLISEADINKDEEISYE